MITPHETSTNLQWVTIHGVRILKMKPAPKTQQLPVMAQSKEGPPFAGCNTKIEPERAAELRMAIKKADGDIARVQRRLNNGRAHYPDEERGNLEELKEDRAKLQAERAYIMEQANPKKEAKPKPKKRHMRKRLERFRGMVNHVTDATSMIEDIGEIKMTETVKKKATNEAS